MSVIQFISTAHPLLLTRKDVKRVSPALSAIEN